MLERRTRPYRAGGDHMSQQAVRMRGGHILVSALTQFTNNYRKQCGNQYRVQSKPMLGISDVMEKKYCLLLQTCSAHFIIV